MDDSVHPASRRGYTPAARGEVSEERMIQRGVSVVLALIAMLAFGFSFGNIWQLGLWLGVSAWVAPLVGPAVDLSVIGLLVATSYLSLHGVSGRRLAGARFLLAASGAATLALNTAEPLARGAYGRAAFDAVGPLLMVGWSEVGPGLLRQIHQARADLRRTVRTRTHRAAGTGPGPDSDPAQPGPSGPAARSGRRGRGSVIGLVPGPAPTVGRRPDPPRPADRGSDGEGLLDRARRIDQQHRAQHQRPISAERLRRELRVGSDRARHLVARLRAASDSPTTPPDRALPQATAKAE